jgi:hypothetical protein
MRVVWFASVFKSLPYLVCRFDTNDDGKLSFEEFAVICDAALDLKDAPPLVAPAAPQPPSAATLSSLRESQSQIENVVRAFCWNFCIAVKLLLLLPCAVHGHVSTFYYWSSRLC